jgi:hypothetical protein
MARMSIIVDSFISLPLQQLCDMPIIAVYNSPSDFPGKYVARLWDINKRATAYAMVADTLEEIRAGIPVTMTRLGPSAMDDPIIVETWL